MENETKNILLTFAIVIIIVLSIIIYSDYKFMNQFGELVCSEV